MIANALEDRQLVRQIMAGFACMTSSLTRVELAVKMAADSLKGSCKLRRIAVLIIFIKNPAGPLLTLSYLLIALCSSGFIPPHPKDRPTPPTKNTHKRAASHCCCCFESVLVFSRATLQAKRCDLWSDLLCDLWPSRHFFVWCHGPKRKEIH